jgi:hypothetical protein
VQLSLISSLSIALFIHDAHDVTPFTLGVLSGLEARVLDSKIISNVAIGVRCLNSSKIQYQKNY